MVASGEAEGPPSDRPDGAAPAPASETPRATSPVLAAASGASPRRSRVGSPRVARVSPLERDVPPDADDDDLGPGIPELLDDDALADLGVARGSRTGLAAAIPLPPEPSSSSAVPSSSEGVFVRGPASSSSTRVGVSNNSIFSNGPKSTPYPGERASTGGAGDGKDSLRRLFNLPDHEQLVEEYLCALYKKILLQGRMYLFTDHVCFYSNVFGYTKIKTIALKDVTIVKRAYTVQVVPNAVEIVHKGKTEFFTSFIFPDKAYKTIAEQWRRCSRYSKIFAAQDIRARRDDVDDVDAAFHLGGATPSPEVAAMLGVSTPSANDGAPALAGEERETLWRRRQRKAAAAAREGGGGPSSTGSRSGAEDASTAGSPRSTTGGPASDDSSSSASVPVPDGERTVDGDDASRRRRRKSAPSKSANIAGRGRRASTPAAFVGSAAMRVAAEAPAGREETDDATGATESAEGEDAAGEDTVDEKGAEAVGGGQSASAVGGGQSAEGLSASASASASAFSVSGQSTSASAIEVALSSSTIAAPIRPADMQTLLETTVECTVSEFFALGWSDTSRDGFASACHESRGETNVRATKWSRHRHHGHARDITFVAPVNATFGPPTTNCHQTQSYHACRGGVLVVDTSQVQTDIPYGDYFRVESRWEVSPAPPRRRAGAKDAEVTPRCSVWVGLRIPFHRSTMLRKVIEQSALEESRKSAEGTLAMMRAELAARNADADAENLEKKLGKLGSPLATGTVPSPRLDRPGGFDVDGVDVSKLNIPEGSRDVIWRMLFGGGTRRPGSGDATPIVDVGGSGFANAEASARVSPTGGGERRGGIASPTTEGVAGRFASPRWESRIASKNRDGKSPRGVVDDRGGSLGFVGWAAFVLVAALVGIAAILVARCGVRFGAAWMGVGEGFSGEYSAAADVARWRRRATALEEELLSLERRAAFVAGEAAHARAALEDAIARLEG